MNKTKEIKLLFFSNLATSTYREKAIKKEKKKYPALFAPIDWEKVRKSV